MIRVDHIHKRFGQIHAVRGVSFDVPAGQIVGILGPNGAGKTTTIRMITGLLPPSAGSIQVDGLDTIHQSIEARRRLGYLPENTPLYPEMRVGDYLAYRGRLYGLTGAARRSAISRVIEQCWLSDVRSRRIGHLSKGYRQRVGLAATLVHSPPVLILDEPTSGLDPTQIAETRALIRNLAGEQTMLLVSHILPEVEKTCDRIMIFARGQIQADGPPEQLVRAGAREGCYIIELAPGQADASLDPLRTRLEQLTDVSAVEISPLEASWSRITLRTRSNSSDPREAIARTCAAHHCTVRELRPLRPSLEQLYITLIERAGTGESRPGDDPQQEGCA